MKGRQTPTFEQVPDYAYTDGPMAAKLAEAFFGKPLPWQQHVLDIMLARDENDDYAAHAIGISVSRQNGKMLAASTDIPTPMGWQKLGEIKVGDYVFGDDGKPTKVVAKYEPDEPNHYEIDFGCAGRFVNETVKAGGGHLWEIGRGGWEKPQVVDTDWIYDNFQHTKQQKQSFSVRLTEPVEYPEATLLIDPYMLGVWLGDGCAMSCEIACHISDSEHYIREFSKRGFTSRFVPKTGYADVGNIRIDGFRDLIHHLGLYNNKYIPSEYLTASVEQRMELLRGLMDTDGSAEKHSTQVSFCQSGRPQLVAQVMELITSLGMRPYYRVKELHKQNPNAKDAQEVYFNADSDEVFSLQRKKDKFNQYATKPRMFNKWYIKGIRKIEASEPYYCLTVDNDSHLFLCTRSYIPTHNSFDVRARCFYGAITSGESILYTCQITDTADEMFSQIAGAFEDEDNEELHELLKATHHANGMQAIELNNGGYIRFSTRTAKLARGRSYDVIIYDEAQTLTRAQQAASLPTIAASKTHNTQVIYLGTPPDPDSNGFVFEQMHARVHDGDMPDIAWMEWAADKIGDTGDRSRWYETNPSLGYLIDERTVEGELTMTREDFARERLGWWTPYVTAQAVIPPDAWKATTIHAIGNLYKRKTVLAVRFSPDGSFYALAGAKSNAVGKAAFELVEIGSTARGTAALADALFERRRTTACVVVDGHSGADALCGRLDQLKVPRGYIVRPSTGDVIASSQGFVDSLRDGSVAHSDQEAMDKAATTATARMIGRDGGWAFDGDGGEAMQACALALWGLRTTKRDPRRRQRML